MKTETSKPKTPVRKHPARGTDGKFAPVQKENSEMPENTRKIIIDLAEKIEQRGRERFMEKSENLRNRILDMLRMSYPNSCDDTLIKIGLATLLKIEADEDVIFAEIRELNTGIIARERDVLPCPIPEKKVESEKLKGF